VEPVGIESWLPPVPFPTGNNSLARSGMNRKMIAVEIIAHELLGAGGQGWVMAWHE
jgi:hypothetical protein